MDDETRTARLLVGMILGFTVGLALAVYVVMPPEPEPVGILLGGVLPIAGLYIGQRVVLWYLAR